MEAQNKTLPARDLIGAAVLGVKDACARGFGNEGLRSSCEKHGACEEYKTLPEVKNGSGPLAVGMPSQKPRLAGVVTGVVTGHRPTSQLPPPSAPSTLALRDGKSPSFTFTIHSSWFESSCRTSTEGDLEGRAPHWPKGRCAEGPEAARTPLPLGSRPFGD